ncbi:hypothetical protein O1M54_45505 [Streptomyces diastatochromogenes]|nr:hypothetical protein [Streptomyces diastatochromogenes]
MGRLAGKIAFLSGAGAGTGRAVAALPVTTTSLTAFLGPVLLLGIGFICVVSSLTSAAVNAVPIEMTGMASGATSLVREFGQGLGPAVISIIAMSAASCAGGQTERRRQGHGGRGRTPRRGQRRQRRGPGGRTVRTRPRQALGVMSCGCACCSARWSPCCWSARTPPGRR